MVDAMRDDLIAFRKRLRDYIFKNDPVVRPEGDDVGHVFKEKVPAGMVLDMMQIMSKVGKGCLKFEMEGSGGAGGAGGSKSSEASQLFRQCSELIEHVWEVLKRDEAPYTITRQSIGSEKLGKVSVFKADAYKFAETPSLNDWRMKDNWKYMKALDDAMDEIWQKHAEKNNIVVADGLKRANFVERVLGKMGLYSGWLIAFEQGSSDSAIDPLSIVNYSGQSADEPRLEKMSCGKSLLFDSFVLKPEGGYEGYRYNPGSVMATAYADNGLAGITKAHIEGSTQTYILAGTLGTKCDFCQPLLNNATMIAHIGGSPIVMYVVPYAKLEVLKALINDVGGSEGVFSFMNPDSSRGIVADFDTVLLKQLEATRIVLCAGQKLALLPGATACGTFTGFAVIERCEFFAPCGLGLSFSKMILSYLGEFADACRGHTGPILQKKKAGQTKQRGGASTSKAPLENDAENDKILADVNCATLFVLERISACGGITANVAQETYRMLADKAQNQGP